ncbi:MAG: LPS-assembly protein LptD [Flavobacteriia bacterium]|nr:LPS-assembly protein LptD [Flavobacteriia bacterium]
MFGTSMSYGNYQEEKKDTLYLNDQSIESPIVYNARDSIYIDASKNQVHLFGNAQVEYEGINMKAGYILIDMDKNEITASYLYDKDSNHIELPEFTDGSDKMVASKLRINTNTKKVYIEEAKIAQSEAFIYMEVGKRHTNEEIHFIKGRFTTCDMEEPHFHFQLSRAIMIPDKKIVTGPMNLFIGGVPTPFGLPFSVIPQQKNRKHGFLFPNIVPMSDYGFGLQDLGYYTPINEKIQTSNYITLYNRGSWGVKNVTNYLVNYKYNGNFDFSYQDLNMGFPTNLHKNNLALKWIHNTDVKASPFWKFNSNINFTSNNNSKANLYQQTNSNYFTNQYNSDINISRNFPGKPYSMGMKLSFKQNTKTKMMTLNSPSFTFNVNRFFPFKKIIKDPKKEWKQVVSRIGIIYRMDFGNQTTFRDSLLAKAQWNNIQNSFINGANQSISIQTTAGIFHNKFKLTPSADYKSTLNFQQTLKEFVPLTPTKDTLLISQIQKTGVSHILSFTMNLSTQIYSYYRFVGKNKPLLRHILSPTIGFNYTPQINSVVSYSDTLNNIIRYSPFEKSLYNNYTTNSNGLITFSFNNTFELKKKSEKDSTGFRKFKIIEQFLINGNYNILKDSMKLSDISLSLRSTPTKALSFVSSASISPYFWNEKGNAIAKYAFNQNGTIGRFTQVNFATTYTLASKESLKKIENNKQNPSNNWNSDYQYFSLHPEQIVDFNIPWKMNLTHNYSIDLIQNTKHSYKRIHTLMLNGDLSFTKRWKISGTTNFDIKTFKIINTRLELTRDMHCWGLSFMWVPTGLNRYFQFRIFATGSMLSGLQQTFSKPPLFF